MGRRFGVGEYRYEVVEGWLKLDLRGAAADVACDSRGRVYVGVRNPKPDGTIGDILGGTGHVLVLDRDGNLVDDWGEVCSSPHGIWINQDDEIFLADTGFHTVTRHAPSGEVLLSLGTRGQVGAPGDPFNLPTHAVQAPNGDIVVSDGYGQNRIHRFSVRGEHILSFGSGDGVFLARRFGGTVTGVQGTGPGELNVPHDVFVDAHSRIYVLDRENFRWQVFTMLGEFVSMCTGLNRPMKMVMDADGMFYLACPSSIEIRHPDGRLVGQWGEQGSQPGEFIGTVHGAWVDADGSLYVAEAGVNNRLQKFTRV